MQIELFNPNITKDPIPSPFEKNFSVPPLLRGAKEMRENLKIKDNSMATKDRKVADAKQIDTPIQVESKDMVTIERNMLEFAIKQAHKKGYEDGKNECKARVLTSIDIDVIIGG